MPDRGKEAYADEPVILRSRRRQAYGGQDDPAAGRRWDEPTDEAAHLLDAPSGGAFSAEMAQLALRVIEAARREAERILDGVQEQCRRLIQETAQQATQILLAAERDAAKIQEAALAEGTRLVVEAQKRAEQADLAARQAEKALRAIEALQAAAGQKASAQANAEGYEGEAAEPEPPQPPLAGRGDGPLEPEATSHHEQEGVSAKGALLATPPLAAASEAHPIPDATIAEGPQFLSSITLVVSPFGSFRALTAFQKALDRIEGVRSVKVRRFHKGTLYASVQYVGVIPLEERLKELVQFQPRVIASANGAIELRIDSGDQRELEISSAD